MKRIEPVKTKPVPFLVNVIGNICSGKSTLMDKLLDLYPEAYFLKIDDYRIRLNANTPGADAFAWNELINDAKTKDFVFVESTGASVHYETLQEKFPGRILTIVLDCKFKICIDRYYARKNLLQISEKYTLESSLEYIQNSIEKIWRMVKIRTVITTDQGIQDYDLEYIQAIIFAYRSIELVKITKPFNPDL